VSINLPLDYFNQSQMNEYLMCGERFRIKYVEGKMSGNLSMTRGRAVHRAAAARHHRMMVDEQETDEEDIAEMTASFYDEEISGEENLELTPEEKRKGEEKAIGLNKDSAIDLARAFSREIAPKVKRPIVIEETIEFSPATGLNLRGTLDLVHIDAEDCVSLADLKTAKRRKSQADIDTVRQLTFYSMLYLNKYKKLPDVVELQVIVANKNPVAQFLYSNRIEYDIKSLLKTIQFVVKNISKGNFGPASDFAWWCKPDQCEHWHRCQYTGGKK
jgi:hypothetical protein